VYRKQHIPPDEQPLFTPGDGGGPFELDGTRFGVAICADIERDDAFDQAAASGAEVVFLCAAPGLYGRRLDEASWRAGFDWWRGECLRYLPPRAQRLGIAIATATQAGSTQLEDYPGGCMAFDTRGNVMNELPDWRAGTLPVELA
jgi:predicted amidohydrolase